MSARNAHRHRFGEATPIGFAGSRVLDDSLDLRYFRSTVALFQQMQCQVDAEADPSPRQDLAFIDQAAIHEIDLGMRILQLLERTALRRDDLLLRRGS